jgi:hypothetical protein
MRLLLKFAQGSKKGKWVIKFSFIKETLAAWGRLSMSHFSQAKQERDSWFYLVHGSLCGLLRISWPGPGTFSQARSPSLEVTGDRTV